MQGEAIATKIFNKSAKDVNKHYMALAFQGRISPPKFFKSTSDLIEFVGKTEGAIGIVPESNAGGATILKVDGANSF